MKKKSRLRKITLVLSQVKSIFPFTQKPPIETPESTSSGSPNNAPLQASDLFSHFTADIIKEKAVFIR